MLITDPGLFLVLCVAYAGIMTVFFMLVGLKLLTGLIAIDIGHELREKNVAVGMAVMGMFFCVGIAVGAAMFSGLLAGRLPLH